MRVVFNEIKKIFGFRTIILLLIIIAIIYSLFISFDIKYFPNGRPAKDYYKICSQMIRDYGTSMDEKEFQNFKELYNKQVEEADKFLQSRPEFVKAGLTTYEKLENIDPNNEELSRLRDKVFFEENRDIFWELETRETIINLYKYRFIEPVKLPGLNKSQAQRINEITGNGTGKSIFPLDVYDNYDSLIFGVAILIVLSLVFMISPIYIKDKSNKVNYMQYTSKTGRRIFKIKLIAALISTFTIMTIYFAAFFILYSHNKTGIFLNSSLNSFLNNPVFWYDMTFRQYILLTTAGIYTIGFSVTLIGAFISRIAPNYITLVGIQVPIFFIIIDLCSKILVQNFASIGYPKFLQPTIFIILVLTGVILIGFRMNREKVVDIVC